MTRSTVSGKRIDESVAGAIGPFSLGVVASGGDLVFLAGQVAWDVSGQIVGKGSMREQYRQVMRNLQAVIEDAGGSMDHICKLVNYVTVPMTRTSPEYMELTEARREFFTGRLPVSTLVQVVSLMDPDALVEVGAHLSAGRRLDTVRVEQLREAVARAVLVGPDGDPVEEHLLLPV